MQQRRKNQEGYKQDTHKLEVLEKLGNHREPSDVPE
jgi:hypothetical protein